MIPSWSGIVIFDGECGVCNAIRERVEAHDRAGRLCFVAYQLTDLERLSPGLTLEMAGHSAYFIYPDGRRVGGARAIFETLRSIPGLWGIIGLVAVQAPFWLLAEPFYYLVARNRALLSSWLGLSSCPVEAKPALQEARNKPSHQGKDRRMLGRLSALNTQHDSQVR